MKSTRGFGFTVKCRKRLTTSLSVKILDWAGPEQRMATTKDKDHTLKVCGYVCTYKDHDCFRFAVFGFTCSKLLNGHEREADKCESFAEDFALILWCGL